MRTFRSLTLLLLLAASATWGAPPADAGDAAAQAEAIGRDLLSPDEAVRARAVQRLLARVERGGDLEAFLRDMARGAAAWADRHDRLMEVWIRQAVGGTPKERETAVRLLAALGPRAVERLAEELRRARGAGASRAKRGPPADKTPSDQAAADRAAADTPRVYDVRDLLAQGVRETRILSLLKTVPQAAEVRALRPGLYVVTAADAGHEFLRARLDQLRAGDAAQDDGAAQAPQAPKGPRSAPAKPAEAQRPPPTSAPPPSPGPPRDQAERDTRTWRVDAQVWQVPLAHVDTATVHGGQALSTPLRRSRDRARATTGSLAQFDGWARLLRRVPDAAQAPEPEAAGPLAAGRPCTLFSGKRVQYARTVVPTDGGAWKIVTGSLPRGLELTLTARPDGDALHVVLTASRTEVDLPLPVLTVRPAPGATPVDLERPDWSVTRTRATFWVPAGGGSAFVALGPLGPASGPLPVVLLRVQP